MFNGFMQSHQQQQKLQQQPQQLFIPFLQKVIAPPSSAAADTNQAGNPVQINYQQQQQAQVKQPIQPPVSSQPDLEERQRTLQALNELRSFFKSQGNKPEYFENPFEGAQSAQQLMQMDKEKLKLMMQVFNYLNPQ